MNLEIWIKITKQIFVQKLTTILNDYHFPVKLNEAINYAIFNGGKRIRPLLVMAVGELTESATDNLLIIAIVVELIHCYSLIHDDLPAIDNDDYRRGKLSTHKKFGEGLAIIAGDSLQSLAFELLSTKIYQISAKKKILLVQMLASAIGGMGMCGGQVIDISSTQNSTNLEQLIEMHNMKTGALIKFAIMAVNVIGEFNPDQQEVLTQLSLKIGLLFQITDDILDFTQNSSELGKTAKKDLMMNKATFVTVLGLSAAQDYAKKLYDEISIAFELLASNSKLKELVDFIYYRKY